MNILAGFKGFKQVSIGGNQQVSVGCVIGLNQIHILFWSSGDYVLGCGGFNVFGL